MPAESILGGINQEATQQELLAHATLLLSMILEKLPRMDANDRLLISHAESTVTLTANQSLATIASLGASARIADAIPLHMSNAGCVHIYDNIKVT